MQRVFLTLWRLLPQFHRRVERLFAMIVLHEILKLAPAAVLAVVVDALIRFDPLALSGAEGARLPMIGALVAGLFVISMIVSWMDIRMEVDSSNIGFDAEVALIRRAAAKLLGLSVGYHERHNTGAEIHRIHRGVDNLGDLLFFSSRDVVPTFVQLVVTLAVLLWIGWIPGLVFVAFLPLFFYLIHRYGVVVQPLRRRYHAKMEEAAGYIGERVMNVRTVQDFAVEDRELERHGDLLREYIRLERERMDYHRYYYLWRDSVMNVARLAIMAVGVWLVVRGQLTPGVLVFFITLTEKANLGLFRLTNVYNRAADCIEAIQRLLDLFDERETVVERSDARPVPPIAGGIAFDHVHFSYAPGHEILHDVAFTVQPRTMTAIIGSSGAGKSTIVKLLYRHFDVDRGSITIDGTDIRDYRLQEYRRQIASVQQDIEVFNATVRENIAFGNPDVSQEEIERVARIAYAHDFIARFPAGYGTLVGERGVKLSGGQRQRIGIARALLAKPAILVFDEATSSLDTESEQLIQRAMGEIARDYTMIVIAHRLSTIERADLVIVLEQGRIAEMGNHEDLIAQRGVYHKMRELQRLGEVRQ